MRPAFVGLVILFFISVKSGAGELEIYGGANSTTYDDASDANTWGVTMRMQYIFSNADDGWLINLNAAGLSPLASELGVGYQWKSHSDLFFEFGIGGAYSRIWGPSPLVIAGFGYRISPSFFVDFPITFTRGIMWTPYLGFSF